MTKLAAILFEDEITKLKLDAYIVNLVHDEIVIESDAKISEQVKLILEKSMTKAFNYFCKTIPCKLESYVGTNWGAKH